MSNLSKEEQIQLLSRTLLRLLEEPDYVPPQDDTPIKNNNLLTEQRNKTISDLNSLGVEISVVRRIMQKVDEVYGAKRPDFISRPLFEEYDDISKKLNLD